MKPELHPSDDGELHLRVAEALGAFEQGGTAALEELCGRHPNLAGVLRQRVLGLAALGLLDELGANDQPPQRLGDFVPLRRLGGGGMGVVYLARQESLGREVALKLIRPDQLHLAGARERFQREVETVARLQHPGIVPVYAVGEERGVPYLAMEHIDGRNLADVVSALAGRDPSALSGADLARAVREDVAEPSWVFAGSYTEACVRLVRQAAEALEHAHRRGVTHRDLKPSNLMVTPDGRALLLDFGLSSFEGSSKLTRTGSQLGSLAYMAPEHLRSGRPGADARGDVYGLGVTLYELLALRSPFARDSTEATRIAVLSGDPTRLRELNRAVSWELETVCMKAMDADPARRYATAADLARDLENVLEQRPIEARRAGAWLRARRWVQRHPTAAVSALAGVIVLFVGPTVFALQQVRARERLQLALDETEAERERATELAGELRVQRDAAQAENARAEANLAAALSAVDVMLARVGDKTLGQVPHMGEVRRGLFEDALAFYEGLLSQRSGRLAALDELELRLKLAHLEQNFGEDAAAEARLADLLERIDRAEGAGEPEDALIYLRGRALNSIASLHYHATHSPESLEEFESSVRILHVCASGPQATPARRITAAVALENLGRGLWQALRPREEVLEVFEGARALRVALLTEDPERILQSVELASVDSMRGRCLTELGRLEEARAAVESAVQSLRLVIEDPPAGRKVCTRIVTTASDLAYQLDGQGDVELSVELLESVRPMGERLARDFPEDQECFANLIHLSNNLAGGLSDLGRLAEAESLLRETVTHAEPRLTGGREMDPLAHVAAVARMNLAEVLLGLGKAEAALLEADRAVAELQVLERAGWQGTARNEISGSLGGAYVMRATVHCAEGAHAAARSDLEQAEPFVARDARDQYELAQAWSRCAAAVERDGELQEGELIALMEQCYGKSLAALARALDVGWSNGAGLREDEVWANLRGTPEFDALLERLAVPQR
jgi:tetratricopeptide (TPR) repeat protein/tRNA A-37 threonylcarbamoyl transferase component Bud32